jgi:hypothetical protein
LLNRNLRQIEVLGNHFVELIAPILLLVPWRRGLLVGGAIQIAFQAVLIISGNLSFLNWLTCLPAILCFDDESLSFLFSARVRARVQELHTAALNCDIPPPLPQAPSWSNIHPSESPLSNSTAQSSKDHPNAGCAHPAPRTASRWFRCKRVARTLRSLALLSLVGYLSIPVVRNLLALEGAQTMNAVFNPWKIVNTYGAFGTITRERHEVVFEGTHGDPHLPGTAWSE